MAKSLVVLAAFLSTMIGVGMHLSPVPVAALYVAVNAVGVLALWILLRREVPWIRFGIRHAQWAVIRRLTGPALSFMSFPLVNALNLQGILVVIGYVMGPDRGGDLQYGANHFSQRCPGNELDQQFDLAGDVCGVRCRSHGYCAHAPPAGVPDFAVPVPGHHSCRGVSGDWIWRVWTVGKVPTDPVLLNIMLLQMVISAFWFTSSVVPMATNQHERMARAMLAATCLALALAWLLMHVNSLGLRGAVIALVAGDLFTAFYVLRESLRLLGDDPGDFARSLLDLSCCSGSADEWNNGINSRSLERTTDTELERSRSAGTQYSGCRHRLPEGGREDICRRA